MRSRWRQRGAALLTALLITAIASVAATHMASRQQLDIRRSGNVFTGNQAYLFALGVETWAMEVLRRDLQDSRIDDTSEDWATVLPALPVEGAVVAGFIRDQQGLFNLNSLIDEDGEHSATDIAMLQRLLRALDLDEDLVWPIVDWVDADQTVTFPSGAEDNEYLVLDHPYRAANHAMASVSELRLVRGITAEDYATLLPHVAALPGRPPINVNTASAEVLMAVVEGLTSGEAERIISEREDEPFENTGEFAKHAVVKGRLRDEGRVSVASEYFMINADVSYGRSHVALHSLVTRRRGDGVRVVRRSRGQGLPPPAQGAEAPARGNT